MQLISRRQQVPRIGRAALQRGLVLGLLNGIISSILTVLAATVLVNVSGILTLLSFPLAWIFFLLAGLLAARMTGRIASAILAGLWTGFISKILSTLLVAIFYLFFQLPRLTGRPVPISRLMPFFLLEFLYLVLDVALGVGFGALGGFISRRFSNVKPLPSALNRSSSSSEPKIPSPLPLSTETISSLPPTDRTPAPPASSTGSPDSYPYGKPFFPLFEELGE